MRKGAYRQYRPLHLLGASFLTLALVLSPVQSVYAATANITQIVAISSVQQIVADTVSAAITLQLQNSSSKAETLTSSGTRLAMSSSSSTGIFYDTSAGTAPRTDTFFSSGNANRSVYYKDTTPGAHTLTFTLQGGELVQPLTTSQQITITAPEVVEPPAEEDPVPPINDPKEEPIDTEPETPSTPVATLKEFAQPHSTKDPVTVVGTLEHIPAEAAVRVTLKNADNQEVIGGDVVASGTDVELAKLDLPADIANGAYTLELTVRHAEVEVVSPQRVTLLVDIPAPEPPAEPAPAPAPTPTPKPVPIAVLPEPPLSLIESQPLPTLSTQFSQPAMLSATKSRNFVVAATTSQRTVATKADVGEFETEPTASSEQSISLKESKVEEAPVVEPSQEGWKLLGAPWYWWGGGAALLYGAWSGVRRLISPGE